MLKTQGLGQKKICIYETYKNTVMPHGRHIDAKDSDMAKATMFVYPQSDHALPHWKFVMQCCAKCPSINTPDQETDDQYSNTSPSICFHIYHIIARCPTHGRLPLTDKKMYCKCKQDSASEQSTKIYTRKEIVMMETTISIFYTSFYIPAIQKLEFHIPHVQILVTNYCGDSRRTAFKCCKSFQDVLIGREYSEQLVCEFSPSNTTRILRWK